MTCGGGVRVCARDAAQALVDNGGTLGGTQGQPTGKDDEQTVRRDSVSCPNMGFTPDQPLHVDSTPHGPHFHHHPRASVALQVCSHRHTLLKASTLEARLPGIQQPCPNLAGVTKHSRSG